MDLRFDDSAGDIDMNLYNAAGTQLAASTSFTGTVLYTWIPAHHATGVMSGMT